MKQIEPIFILWARSFWLGILPTVLIVLDGALGLFADPSQGPPLAGLIASFLGLDGPQVEGVMLKLAPMFALFIAHQRSGSARPYSLNPADAT